MKTFSEFDDTIKRMRVLAGLPHFNTLDKDYFIPSRTQNTCCYCGTKIRLDKRNNCENCGAPVK